MRRAAEQERQLAQHLLGQLPEAEAETLEERLFADDELRAELLATADDLIHSYLVGGLTRDDRERFETHFLASPRHRERVAYIRDLLSAVARVPAPSVAKARPKTGFPVHVFWPTWALAAALALVVAGGLLWLIRQRSEHEGRLAHATPLPATPASTPAPLRTPTPSTRTSPEAPRAPIPTPGVPRSDVRMARLPAQPGGPVSVALGRETRALRVEVPVPPGPPSFDAILRRLDGTEVWRMEALVPPSLGKPLVFSIPARLFAAAEYVLRIEGEGLRGPAATPPPPIEYTLRVSKER
jgi:anti-sigma factor RsiW